MSFFKKLANVFSAPSRPSSWEYWLVVKCNRCGEVIRTRVDLRNDLSIEYGDGGGGDTTYFTRKTIVGNQRCYQPIEVEMTFDRNHKLIDRKIRNGKFVE